MEDILTSNVFGQLRYAPETSGLFPFLAYCRYLDDRGLALGIRLWHTLNDPRREIAEDPAPRWLEELEGLLRRNRAPNDSRRDIAEDPSPLSQEALQGLFLRNLEALLPLLDENEPSDRLMKGEALREMGRFDEAMRLLMRTPKELEPHARVIRALAMKLDARVAKLEFNRLRLTH